MTKTEICNIALTMLSAGRIDSLDEDTELASDCKLLYAPSKSAVLESLDWTFARKRESLSLVAEAPAFGYGYQHQLPSSCISIVSSFDTEDWEQEGRRLLSDSKTQRIVYTSDTAEGEFTGMFTQALAAYLAVHLGYRRTESSGKVDRAVRLYEYLMTQATGNTNRARIKRNGDAGALRRVRISGR